MNSVIEIDDFFVSQDQNELNLETLLSTIIEVSEAGVEKEAISLAFSSLANGISTNAKVLFRKSAEEVGPKQSFWFNKIFMYGERYSALMANTKYVGIDKSFLTEFAKISSMKMSCSKAQETLLKHGIILLFVDPPNGTKIDGATYISKQGHPIIGMSLRYDRIDYFWFTLLHELAHVVLHYENAKAGILSIESDLSAIEVQANRLAKDSIIAPSVYRSSKPRFTLNNHDLNVQARSIGIHPAILAGIIRNDLKRYNIFSEVITKSKFKSEISFE